MKDLLSPTTLFKDYVLKISINRLVLNKQKNVIEQHRNKLYFLLEEKYKNRGRGTNLKAIVTNLSNHVFIDGQYDIL